MKKQKKLRLFARKRDFELLVLYEAYAPSNLVHKQIPVNNDNCDETELDLFVRYVREMLEECIP